MRKSINTTLGRIVNLPIRLVRSAFQWVDDYRERNAFRSIVNDKGKLAGDDWIRKPSPFYFITKLLYDTGEKFMDKHRDGPNIRERLRRRYLPTLELIYKVTSQGRVLPDCTGTHVLDHQQKANTLIIACEQLTR